MQAPSLPPRQRARLEYLFEAGSALARRWPRLAGELPCVLLVEPAAQWLVHCERAPARELTLQAERFRGRPVFARSGDQLTIDGQVVPTQQWLARAAATAHVEPIDAAAAGAVGPGLVVVGTLEAVRAARSDFRDCTTDEWLSVALHEVMHVWQLREPGFALELRGIGAGTLAPSGIRALFVYDARYRAMVEREYRLLASAAARPPDRAAAVRALRNWQARYHVRRAYLARRPDADQLVHADAVFTYLEGIGRYVESTFLVDPTLHPTHPIADDPDFHTFERYAGAGYAAMQNRQLDAEYDYALGFHLALLLDRVDPDWQGRVHGHPERLVGLARELGAARPPRPARRTVGR